MGYCLWGETSSRDSSNSYPGRRAARPGHGYGRVETNPTLVQPLGLDEIVVIMELTIKFPNCSGRMSVCLPGMMLTNLFGEINRLNASPINSDKGTYQAILDSIQDTDIELVGEMCQNTVRLMCMQPFCRSIVVQPLSTGL